MTKLKDYEIQEKLRELSNQTKKTEVVLLPDCTPLEFCNSEIDVEFKNVNLAKLLHFIADMM